MDHANLFMTPVTYRMLRLEYLAGLVACVVLLLLHLDEIRWLPFVGLFAVIDVVGYLPGHLAWRRSRGRHVPRVFFVLYNTMHSLLTAGVIAAVWSLLVGPEWALLALPVHLFGDRSLFGSFPKPFGVEFEPVPHPAYTQFRSTYERAAVHPGAPAADDAERVAVG